MIKIIFNTKAPKIYNQYNKTETCIPSASKSKYKMRTYKKYPEIKAWNITKNDMI